LQFACESVACTVLQVQCTDCPAEYPARGVSEGVASDSKDEPSPDKFVPKGMKRAHTGTVIETSKAVKSKKIEMDSADQVLPNPNCRAILWH
jgi:hypothetical protein